CDQLLQGRYAARGARVPRRPVRDRRRQRRGLHAGTQRPVWTVRREHSERAAGDQAPRRRGGQAHHVNGGGSSVTTGHVSTKDNNEIFFKDWGKGQPVLFSHGWPLTADAWDDAMMMVADKGFRGIAHDRRGGGRSSQPWESNDLDAYADDLSAVMETLDLRDVVLVGHSTGGGEITRYVGRHGTSRVSKMVLVGAIPPLRLKTDKNPEGLPIDVFDGLRQGISADRSQFYEDLSMPFYGANRSGSKVSQGLRDQFWQQSMTCGLKGAYDCIKAFSETDLTMD